jgi:hypothetical protein
MRFLFVASALVLIGILTKMTISEQMKERNKLEKRYQGRENEQSEDSPETAQQELESLALVKIALSFVTFNYGVTNLDIQSPAIFKQYFNAVSAALSSISSIPNFACALLAEGYVFELFIFVSFFLFSSCFSCFHPPFACCLSNCKIIFSGRCFPCESAALDAVTPAPGRGWFCFLSRRLLHQRPERKQSDAR